MSSVLRTRVQSLGELCDTFLEPEEHHHARSLLSQAQRALERAFQTVSERAQLLGETRFHSGLEKDDAFWVRGVRRWGEGAGYVADILDMNKSWFSENRELNEEVRTMITREWKRAMKVVASMLEDE